MTLDLTFEEKLGYAQGRAREDEAEKHFFDLGQPFYPLGFAVTYRNPGHWDISAKRAPGQAAAWKAAHPSGRTSVTDLDRERAFRIRGEPGAVMIFDERWNPHKPHPRDIMTFRTVTMAMLWIVEELMREPAPAVKSPESLS